MGIWNFFFGNSIPQAQNQQTAAGVTPPRNVPQAQFRLKTKIPSTPIQVQNNPWADIMNKGKKKPASELTVYGPNGTPLKLHASNEKAVGGEGTIYEMPINSNILIKIYKSETLLNPEKRAALLERLTAMVNLREKFKEYSWLAWPHKLVFDEHHQVIGFVMNKVTGKSLYTLENRKKLQEMVWDREDLVKTAIDYVKKIQILAMDHILVNDFNPANVLFNDRREIMLIDCDSFQVPGPNGKVLTTGTFFPSHTAPELLNNKSLLDRPRDLHQLEFCVTLTVFNILMNGLHPYSYYDPSNQSSCGAPDENLKRGRCPLGPGSDCMFPVGDWYKVWRHLTLALRKTFITTFKEGHRNPSKRVNLSYLQYVLTGYLMELRMDPSRRELFPKTVKPAGRKTPYGKSGIV